MKNALKTEQFLKDKSSYLSTKRVYFDLCEQSEVSREKSLELRDRRWTARNDMATAAENLLMNVQGLLQSSLEDVGLWDMYQELTSGNCDRGLLFKIADETAKM